MTITPGPWATMRYAKAAEREHRRFMALLSRGESPERLRTDMVLKARRREAERLRLECSPAVQAATLPHTERGKT